MKDSPCPLCGYFHDNLTPHGRNILNTGRVDLLKTDSGDASSVRSFRIVGGGSTSYDKLVQEAMGPSNNFSVSVAPVHELGQFNELLSHWKWVAIGFVAGYLTRRHFVR